MARNCKYHKIETKVSYDDGQTWESQTPPVYHIGGLIEAHSQDCETGTTLERWITVEGDYLCEGNNKWTKQLLQNSYDGGVTWYASAPTTFRLGEFVEVDEEYCMYASESHYVIPSESACIQALTCPHSSYPVYFYGNCYCQAYIDPIKIIKCSTDTLTESNLVNGNYGLETLNIGECTRVIDINSNSNFAKFKMRPYLTTIDTRNAVNLETIDSYSFYHCDGWLQNTSNSYKIGNGLQSVTIPSSVTSIGDSAFMECSAMTDVIISNAACSIGQYAFSSCTSLSGLTLGNNLTSIGSGTFKGCVNITSNIIIPSTVTSIGSDAFSGCSGITSITIQEGVTHIGSGAFNGTSITDLTIPNSVVSGQPFPSGCQYLTGATIGSGISSYNTDTFASSPVRYLSLNCETISKYDTSVILPFEHVILGNNVKNIGASAFYQCPSLTSVTIPNSVTSIGGSAFGSCTSLTSITIPNSVTSIGNYAFQVCTSLTSITIPNSVTSIGNYAFQVCSGLTSITIPSGVTSIGNGAFGYCYGLTSCTISSGVTSIGDNTFYRCSGLTSVDIPDSVTSIGDSAFSACTSLTSCTIGSGVTSIGSRAFMNCSGLTSITIEAATPPTLDGTQVFSGTNCTIYVPCDSYYAYRNDSSWYRYNTRIRPIQPCDYQYKASVIYGGVTTYDVLCDSNSALTSTELSRGGSISNITSADIGNCTSSISANTFQNCSRLTNIHISSSVTSVGNNAFYGCSALSEVHIDDVAAWCNIDFTTGLSTNPLTKSGKLYLNNQRVRNLSIPSGVTSIGNYAFNGFTDLTSMTLSNTVSSIGNSTFYRCGNLSSVDFGSGLTSIGTSAFTWCTGLTSVELLDSITTIGESAFRNCSGATSFGIGSGITSIGASAFTNCSSLTAITISASTPPRLEGNMDRRTFENTNNCPIYVPCASVNAYKTAGGWNSYLSRIQGFGICPSKLIATYSDSTVDTIDCNGDSSLNWSETSNMSNPVSSMTVADIGNCATNINGAFNGATSLTSVTMPDSVVSLVNNAFRNCSGLTSIDLSSGLTTIGEGSFRNCKELTAITIPSGVTSIGDWAFYNCARLTSMTIEATTPPTLGSNALEFTNNCPIYVPADSLSAYQSASGWSDYASRIQAIPSTVKLLATYTDSSVSRVYCNDNPTLTRSEITSLQTTTAMTDANIGSCVTSIGSEAFKGCTSLSSVTLSNTVTSIGDSVFSHCESLSALTIPSSVTSIGSQAFYYCTSLSSVTIPNSVTSIGSQAFQYCTSLSSIVVDSNNTVYDSRDNCNAIIKTSTNTLIAGCKNTVIPNSVTSIGNYAFNRCSGLTEVTIPDSVTSIGITAFRGCSGLTEVTIPNSVTSIGYMAFERCTSLSSITIGSGVTSIGNYAFQVCSGLTSIVIEATTPPTLGSNALEFTNNCPIYVPAASLSTYQSASGWIDYASRIQAFT